MLAQLEADSELAGTVGSIGASGMSSEEQALFDELEAEAGGGAPATSAASQISHTQPASPAANSQSAAPDRAPASRRIDRGEAEPG